MVHVTFKMGTSRKFLSNLICLKEVQCTSRYAWIPRDSNYTICKHCTFAWKVGNKPVHDILVSSKAGQGFLGKRNTSGFAYLPDNIRPLPTRTAEMDSTESGPYESNVTESVTSSSSSTLIPTVPPPTPYERRNTFRNGSRWEVRLFWANAFFAFVVVAGQTGEFVSFPLWINSTAKGGNSSAPTSGSYFVLLFASLSFVVIFGLGTVHSHIFAPRSRRYGKEFSTLFIILSWPL